MQREFETKTPSLAASTELLVMAPIKPGFVPTLDTITYKSRVKQLLKLLHAGRQSQHEYRLLRAVSDAVERVGVIRSLRVAVVEGGNDSDDRILLSVHFDGSYEAYARTIWQRAARLLDLIFCNADGYTTGWDHSFDDWNAWIRSVQVPTPFFYATPGLTYPDQTYLLMLERRDRGGADDENDRTRISVPTAEKTAWSILEEGWDPTKRATSAPPGNRLALTAEAIRQNLGVLAGLFRLADWYRPDTDDGKILRQAAHELLPQMRDVFLDENASLRQSFLRAAGQPLQRQISWFQEDLQKLPPCRQPEPLPGNPLDPLTLADVQGGILSAYEGVTDGVMVLIAFPTAKAAATFLRDFRPSREGERLNPEGRPLANLALTFEGLRACGLPQVQIDALPVEFRQGMAARAGVLGDVRWNHPRRWALPRRNGLLNPDPKRDDSGLPSVPLEAVHALVQFRSGLKDVQCSDPRAPALRALQKAVEALRQEFPDVDVLSVQWLARQTSKDGSFIDHFGYTDGQSQPSLQPGNPNPIKYPNQVHLGEVLLGHPNAADRAEDLAINREGALRDLMRNGSFLVVRKLRQDVSRFRASVAQAAAANGLDDKRLRAMMMGRWPSDGSQEAGKPLATQGSGGINDFNYLGDPEGEVTPSAAHIRRANPREVPGSQPFPSPAPGGRAPRIMRRSLPYGPSANETTEAAGTDSDRGLMFMAYNASIAEQFEVIQGWLAGGNSSRGYSGATCPFLGVPEAGRRRNFRFLHPDTGKTVHMAVDGSDDLSGEPKPLVTLQWGLYAFAPSRRGQALLAAFADKSPSAEALPWSVARGRDLIDRLRRIETDAGPAAAAAAWKAALEDPDALARFDSASIWAAVRQLHGGMLRIPYGVLVGAPALVDAVLRDETRYTVTGYLSRLVQAGMGPIFLGRDADDPNYRVLSEACNRAVESIDEKTAFQRAQLAASKYLQRRLEDANEIAESAGEPEWECAIDGRDLVSHTLAALCEDWFGLDGTTREEGAQDTLFRAGALDWNWQVGKPVPYPGHFTAASRATFQPEPSSEVLALAKVHGHALTKALDAFVRIKMSSGGFAAPVSKAVLDSLWQSRPRDAVHTIAGAMMGFLPTTEGILLRVLAEWTRDGTLLELASRAQDVDSDGSVWQAAKELLDAPLRRALKFRPVPEQIWREVKARHRITGDHDVTLEVEAGEKLILGQVSVLHAQLERGDHSNVVAAFGGPRGPKGGVHPTHACPGYSAAIGSMVGLLVAAVWQKGVRLVPGSSPGVLIYRGRTKTKGNSDLPMRDHLKVGEQFVATSDVNATTGSGQVLLAFGDSWMEFPESTRDGSDFKRAFRDLGYITDAFHIGAKRGCRLSQMSAVDPNLDDNIYGHIRRLVKKNQPPLAVLLGGGGNDFVDGKGNPDWLNCKNTAGVESPLDSILKDSGSNPAYDSGALDRFVNQMKEHLGSCIERLAEASRDSEGRQLVHIVVHAYDHPVPDGSKFLLLCPWLRPAFERKGFMPPDQSPSSKEFMQIFIDALNDGYEAQVKDLQQSKKIEVSFVRLAGRLAQTPEYQQTGYKTLWDNELHPNKKGFTVLAEHIHQEVLQKLPRVQAAAGPTAQP